jgi:hypothetical protein
MNIVSPLMLQFARTARSQVKLGDSAAPLAWYISAGEPRLRVTATSTASIDVSSSARALHVGWGLQNVCDQEADQVSRVRFSVISYLSGTSQPQTLLERAGALVIEIGVPPKLEILTSESSSRFQLSRLSGLACIRSSAVHL